jgi:Lrp/AsnC family leucine-responsive transcriptional regulator
MDIETRCKIFGWEGFLILDDKDAALIKALQDDAFGPFGDLAEIVHLSLSTVYDRLHRLERLGIIRQWTIKVDAQVIGLRVLAFVGVRATKPEQLKVRVANIAALHEWSDRLFAIPGVERTETTIVLRTQIDRPTPVKLSIPSDSKYLEFASSL